MKKHAIRAFLFILAVGLLASACSEDKHAERGEGAGMEEQAASGGDMTGGTEPGGMAMADAAKGGESFGVLCASCHGAGGAGDGAAAVALDPKPRNLADAGYVSTLSDDHLFEVISEGGASVDKSPLMPAWKGALSTQGVRDVIAHIRANLCKCSYGGK